jgi:transmembrane sensor
LSVTREHDWVVLSRYLAGETPFTERARVEQWIREDPEREQLYEELCEIWGASANRVDVSRAWDSLVERLERVQGVESRPQRTPERAAGRTRTLRRVSNPHRWHGPGIPRAAAVLVLIVGGGLLARHVSVDSPSTGSETRWEAGQLYATVAGELSRFSLSDGSEVVLGVRSELQVASDFGVRTRDVRVSGEAFFDVEPDPEAPFVVHTKESSTQVVGTSFSVRSRGSGTAVVVREGKVRVTPLGPDGESAELPAGTFGRVGPDGSSVEVASARLDDELAWMSSRLVFRNMRFQDVLEGLELWYDVNFRVDSGTLAERRLNAILDHPPLGELLEAVAAAADAAYELDEDMVTFFPRP